MEVEGLVRRIPYPGDKRRQLVEITDEGRALQERMWAVSWSGHNRSFISAKLHSDKEAGKPSVLLLKLIQE